MEVRRLTDRSNLSLGRAGSLMIQHVRAQPSLEALEDIDRVQTAYLLEHTHLFTLTLLGVNQRPSDVIRDRSVALAAKFSRQTKSSAIVIGARGLGAMVARTFISTIFLFSRGETRNRVFSSVDDALAWLKLEGDHTFDELTVADVARFTAAERPPAPA